MPSWMSPASRRRSSSCAWMTCSTKFSCARSRATSWRCIRAWCMAPAISRPMTRSSSTSRSANSRRCTVCTLRTPTSPPGSVSIGTETIEVKSEPRSDSNGLYRGSDSLSWMITTGSRWLATHPDIPCPKGSRILPTSLSKGGVAPVRVSERSVSSSTRTKQTSGAVAAVIILAAASASGSTPGPLDAAWINSRSSASSRSASTRSRTALGLAVIGASLVDAFSQCGRDGAGTVTDAELAVDGPQVGLDGFVADHQLVGDALVGQPVDDDRQDFALALCQPLPGTWPELVALQPRRGVDGTRRHAGVDGRLAAVHELELTDEFVAADALQQVAGGTHPQRLEEVLLVVVDRKHHDLAARVLAAKVGAQVQPAGALHADVAQDDVGVEMGDDAERALSPDGLAHYLHPVAERGQHRLEPLDDHLVVIDEYEPDRIHAITLDVQVTTPTQDGPQDGYPNPPFGGVGLGVM